MMAPLSAFILFPQVVAMQILYGFAVLAVFVLCVALLSTARRILRASPLESGQLALSSIQDFDRSDDDGLMEIHAVEAPSHPEETPSIEWKDDLEEENLPQAHEVEISELTIGETAASQPSSAAFVQAMSPLPVDNLEIVSESEEQDTFRFRKPSRRTYNYALECLLLGISAWVLIQTQRTNMQQRVSHSSRDRVA